MKNKKHKCKLCTKSFLNGRALGGHMRSHFVMATLPLRPTHQQPVDSSSSNSDIQKLTSKNEEEEKSCAVPGFNKSIKRRGKPKMLMPSRKTVTTTTNPEFMDSVTESETESAQDQYPIPPPPMPRRPYKRARSGGRQLKPVAEGRGLRGGVSGGNVSKKCKKSCRSSVESDSVATESVPASTVSSDGLMTQLDEDVAMWLVMLSRDKWEEKDEQQQVLLKKETGIELLNNNNNNHHLHQLSTTDNSLPCKEEEQQHLFELDCSNSKSLMSGQKPRSKKKGKRSVPDGFGNSVQLSMETGENCGGKRDRVFECPDCCKVFGSAQAFGGHKRWRHHLLMGQGPSSSTSPTTESSDTKANACSSSSDIGSGRVEWIDLNLPPPVEDEEDYYNEILVH